MSVPRAADTMAASVVWPPALAGTPAITVIERAIERQRLSHSLLLHGDDHATLVAVAHAIADRLLNAGQTAETPEPATLALLALGAAGLAAWRRKKPA